MAFRNVSNALIHKCKIAQDIEHAMYPLVHKTLTSLRMASNEIRFLLFQESCEFLFIIRTLIPFGVLFLLYVHCRKHNTLICLTCLPLECVILQKKFCG